MEGMEYGSYPSMIFEKASILLPKQKKENCLNLTTNLAFPRALSRTWTLLAESVEPGSTLLRQHTVTGSVRLVSYDG